jgi:hypothetical protein
MGYLLVKPSFGYIEIAFLHLANTLQWSFLIAIVQAEDKV